IGSHGHTLRHRPLLDAPFSWQIGDPNVIAERTGITTVADFRRRDVAAGGQGAPLVPAFHAHVFGDEDFDRVVLNIGGIANVTILPDRKSQRPVRGFDTGPGNALLNDWTERHLGKSFDDNGNWARSGVVCDELLSELLKDTYFTKPVPKSCGREQFNLNWLEERLFHFPQLRACDVQATLVELTAATVALAIKAQASDARDLFVCGGGAHNAYLMERIAALSGLDAQKTEMLGVPADWVEAMAFAWLAWQTLERRTGNLPSVTGASRPVILGAIYPA
ncbi:MAG TPA: anhydro-N-acetylmuramic acid kinase, partial [Pseudomonadales bacterium]|nr:anhydro-N-acetylmuramic acid kinase [Pseudomonadales bacterium]